tara:strand:+ start:11688 stop:11945 length:258 start_codon:yes stop_codon:yes gene_type:complete
MEDRLKLWMYKNDYATTDRHPSKTGKGEITKIVLKEMVDAMKESGSDTIEVKCAGWERVSKKGTPYFFVTIELDKKSSEEQEVPF